MTTMMMMMMMLMMAAFVISDSYEDNADVSISSANRAGHTSLHLEHHRQSLYRGRTHLITSRASSSVSVPRLTTHVSYKVCLCSMQMFTRGSVNLYSARHS